MLTPSAPRALSPVVVAVLDRVPDPPATFTAADVLDALAEARAAGVVMAGADGWALDVAGVLDAMLAAELASCTPATLPTRYVVHPDARPF